MQKKMRIGSFIVTINVQEVSGYKGQNIQGGGGQYLRKYKKNQAKQNRALVREIISASGNKFSNLNKIINRSNLSKSTIMKAIKIFMKNGVIERKSAKRITQFGRPAYVYRMSR